MKFASLYILTTPAVVLVGAGLAMALPGERAAMLNSGPHGFSEVLYAFTSAANNNGSAFAGLTRQHRLVQHRARSGDAPRPLPADGVRPGARRLARRAAAGPGHRGHPAHSPAAVRRPADRSDPHRRRSHVLPGARARARSRKVCTDVHDHRSSLPPRRAPPASAAPGLGRTARSQAAADVLPRRRAQARSAGRWSTTRSCSWSRSGRC